VWTDEVWTIACGQVTSIASGRPAILTVAADDQDVPQVAIA
jgi:hypothetical protein